MFVWDQGVIMPSEMNGFDELDEVFLHLAPEMSDNLSGAVANHLDNGDELAAAQALAAFAERRQLPVSRADRRTLRDVIESHNGDLTCIDLLDDRAGARLNGDTKLLPALPLQARDTVPMRTAPRPPVADVAAAQTAVLPLPVIRPLGTGAHHRW
ncbi:hypothetical protein [Saccharopolyspora shandongensis]|uniref:hypothetical protein n=1 Tax=Saccharopolyspora shandongensis TaxID=418495 RepID=UPI0033E34C98